MLRFFLFLSISLSGEALANSSNTALPERQVLGIAVSTTPFFLRRTLDETSEGFGSTTRSIGNKTTVKRRFNDHFSLGLDFTFSNQEIDGEFTTLGFDQITQTDQDRYQAGLFSEFFYKGVTVKSGFRGGVDDYEIERQDILTGALAVSNPNGFNLGSNVEISAFLPLTKKLFLRPSSNFDYSFFAVEAFSETGAGLSNLAFDTISDTRIKADIGLGLTYILGQGKIGDLFAFSNAKYTRSFINGSTATGVSLASGLFDFGEIDLLRSRDANGYTIDAGFALENDNGLKFAFFYQRTSFSTSEENLFSTRLALSF